MHISAAVTTAPRETSYLQDTLESLHAAGFEYPLVIRDGRPLLGAKPTFKRALWSLRAASWVAVFQDDVLVARGLRSWLESQELPRAVHSLYTSSVHDHGDGWQTLDLEPKPWNMLPWHNSLGACVLLLPGEIAVDYLANDPQFVRTDRLGGSIGEYCHLHGVPFITHSPSLVQHIGTTSCRTGVPITDERRAKRFCDDVRSLGGFAELETPVAYSSDHRAPENLPADRGHNGVDERVPADA